VNTPSSPDLLTPPPARGAGVRRLNRIPLMIAMAILALIMATIAYTYHMRLQQARSTDKAARTDAAIGVLAGAPDAGYILPKAPDIIPVLPAAAAPAAERPLAPEPEKPHPYRIAWENYFKRLEQLRQAREQVALAAIEATPAVQASLPRKTAAETAAAPPLSASEQFTKYAAERLAQLTGGEQRDADLNRQNDKAAFAAEREPKTAGQNTLKARREAARSPYELRAGAIIPAVMIGGANSDLPGQLLAQVASNVYDTATGRLILIPQGSKLIGTYDSRVTAGQERILVAWTRIVFPDASALDLGRMPGADAGGYAGLNDEVNEHFWKIWSNALLLSAFSAGIQLSQGNGNNQTNGLNATQTIAASTGQQMGQLGMEIARRNLQIQPTLEVRPGYRFIVQVTKDLLLSPWIPKDKATSFISGYPYREGVQQ
jgi:type IV secretion system protein VirB10